MIMQGLKEPIDARDVAENISIDTRQLYRHVKIYFGEKNSRLYALVLCSNKKCDFNSDDMQFRGYVSKLSKLDPSEIMIYE